MKKILLLIAVAASTTAVYSQAAKSVYAELGGPGIASVNFDTRFTNQQGGFGARAGIGGFTLGTLGSNVTTIFVPVGLNYLIGGESSHYFELGAGVTPVIASSSIASSSSKFNSTFGWGSFGYRYQPLEKGVTFRASINPLIAKGAFWPFYGGISFGYKF